LTTAHDRLNGLARSILWERPDPPRWIRPPYSSRSLRQGQRRTDTEEPTPE
jgi:hypothetical protein